MKGLIYIDEKYLINNKFDLIENQTLLLKICGKNVVEYYFDFLYTLGVDEIFIVGTSLHNQIAQSDFVKHSTIKITVLPNSTLKDCIGEHNDLFENEQLLVIENIGFIFDDYINKKSLEYNTKVSKGNFSIYYIEKYTKDMELHSFNQKNFLKIKSLESIKDYIKVTNKILNNLSKYDSIPGYTKENNIVIGKNVKIDSDCKLNAPLVILDNVKVCKGAILGPNSIIGQDSFIHENSKVINSIVYDNSYIGENLNIDNKIVSSSNLIDKTDVEVYKVDDIFLSKNNRWFF